VLLADDAYAFMVAWEVMALSSYFLVTTDHKIPEIRRAGFLYLLIAHVGAVSLLLCFGVLQGGEGDYTFDTMRAGRDDAVLGLGRLPAGALRLRRQGRPGAAARLAARSAPGRALAGVALMSGVMLKTAIYGLLRVTFDLLNIQLGWWGTLALALGLAPRCTG
jgi:hydrogenase-4 component B